MKKYLPVSILLSMLLLPGYGFSQDSSILFFTPEGAQQHCPKDTVVWVTTKQKLYAMQAPPHASRDRYGAYMCFNDAQISGFQLKGAKEAARKNARRKAYEDDSDAAPAESLMSTAPAAASPAPAAMPAPEPSMPLPPASAPMPAPLPQSPGTPGQIR